MNYNTLIKKYYKNDGANPTGHIKTHKAERSRNKYRKQRRLEAKQKHRYLILKELIKETPFHITETQTKQITYWITTFNENFKNFNRKASEETIILAFIMIQRKQTNPKMEITRYKISKKYKLTPPVFTLIQNRLIFELMRTTPLTYTQSEYYDHHILTKERE